MTTNVTREKALLWTVQGTLVVLVLVAAFAVTEYLQVDELEGSLSRLQAESQKAGQESAVARQKMQDELKAAGAKLADLEAKQRYADGIRALLASIEPQIAPVLEAAGKTGKPDARAAALAGAGLIGQIAHGANHEAALAALDRALALDKGNCVAGLAVNFSSVKRVEVASNCQALLPAAAAPAEAKPGADAKPAADPKTAADAKPAADAKAPAAADAGAGKAAQPAGKN